MPGHTPEQADRLWCPMVRMARRETTYTTSQTAVPGLVKTDEEQFVIGGCNRDALGGGNYPAAGIDRHAAHTPLASARCISDKCAMWRWMPKLGPDKSVTSPFGHQVTSVGEFVEPTHGYCGLAGALQVSA